jgi:hypothetical protein
MEDNKEPQAPQQNSVPVMDIQPVRPVQMEQPAPAPAPAGPPASEQPSTPIPAGEADAPAVDTTQQAPVLAAIAPGHNPHRTPFLAIISAILIAGIFAAVAVMVYLSGSNKEQLTDSSQQTTSNTAQESTATPEDITETEKAIDDSLSSLNDATDYNDAEVSDTTLGL